MLFTFSAFFMLLTFSVINGKTFYVLPLCSLDTLFVHSSERRTISLLLCYFKIQASRKNGSIDTILHFFLSVFSSVYVPGKRTKADNDFWITEETFTVIYFFL